MVKNIIKNNHIFNNITLVLKSQVIKVFLKSNMAIIWIDIWNIQSGSKAKMLINRCFNVGNYITTIWGANINSSIPQCKNCWRWDHSTFSCWIQETKCIKCNSSHKSKYHWQLTWYCKANKKTNPPQLETEKSEPCFHFFKCSNC